MAMIAATSWKLISALIFIAGGIDCEFVQDNQLSSIRGVLLGLHFQIEHPQAKLVRVVSGKVFDVAVDLHKGSPTYGKWDGVVLSTENKHQFYSPWVRTRLSCFA